MSGYESENLQCSPGDYGPPPRYTEIPTADSVPSLCQVTNQRPPQHYSLYTTANPLPPCTGYAQPHEYATTNPMPCTGYASPQRNATANPQSDMKHQYTRILTNQHTSVQMRNTSFLSLEAKNPSQHHQGSMEGRKTLRNTGSLLCLISLAYLIYTIYITTSVGTVWLLLPWTEVLLTVIAGFLALQMSFLPHASSKLNHLTQAISGLCALVTFGGFLKSLYRVFFSASFSFVTIQLLDTGVKTSALKLVLVITSICNIVVVILCAIQIRVVSLML